MSSHYIGLQVLLLVLLSFSLCAQPDHFAVQTAYDAKAVEPILDQPLRDPHVLAAPDGWYYLTGTSGEANDRENNPGVLLWRSQDLANWESMGAIWTAVQDTFWRKQGWAMPGKSYTEPSKALVAPEIHYIKGQYYLVVSMNFGGIGLLRSTSGRPEGPYLHWAKLRDSGSEPSLFSEGSQTYLTWDGGWIARLSEDLTSIDERPQHIIPELTTPKRNRGSKPLTDRVGTVGAQLLKVGGKYCWMAADPHWRMGMAVHDLFIAISEGDPYGPYHARYLAVPHVGQGGVFRGFDEQWYAVISGHPDDPQTFLPGRVGIIALETYTLMDGKHVGLRASSQHILEKGVMGSLKPIEQLAEEWLTEPSICQGHDSAYYLVATRAYGWKIPKGGIEIWRSTDLQSWTSLGTVWSFEDHGSWHTDYIHRTRGGKNRPCSRMSSPEIAFIKGRYVLTINFDCGVIGLLQSEPNRPEGPYSDPASGPVAEGSKGFLFSEQNQVFLLWDRGKIAKLSNNLDKVQFTPQQLTTQAQKQIGFEGCAMVKFKGKYIFTMADWHGDHLGTYDLMYAVADRMYGPYERRKLGIPHGGNSSLFQNHEGRLFATIYGNDQTSPFHMRVGIVEIDFDTHFNLILKDTQIGY